MKEEIANVLEKFNRRSLTIEATSGIVGDS